MSRFPSYEQLLDSRYIEKQNNKVKKILLVSSKSFTIQQVSKTCSLLGKPAHFWENLLISRKSIPIEARKVKSDIESLELTSTFNSSSLIKYQNLLITWKPTHN